MPRKKRGEHPSLRRHKARGFGVVTLNGTDIYLGSWPADQEEPPTAVQEVYDRAIAEWLQRGRRPPTSPAAGGLPAVGDEPGPQALTVAELIARWWKWAESYYVHPDGTPTGELDYCRAALRPLNHLYGGSAAAEFGPLKLKAVRELMVRGYTHPKYGEQGPLTRTGVNGRCRRIVRVFRWAVAEELVPAEVLQALRSVPGLSKGRSAAREAEPVRPVAVGLVEKTLPHLRPSPAALVRVQMLTGMRPGEVCRLTLEEIDRAGDVWLYRPERHKTAHRGRERVVVIGPRAQAAILEFVRVRCHLCGVEGRPPRIGCRGRRPVRAVRRPGRRTGRVWPLAPDRSTSTGRTAILAGARP